MAESAKQMNQMNQMNQMKRMKPTKHPDLLKRVLIFALLTLLVVIVVMPYIWMLSNSFKSTKETLTDPAHLIPRNFTTRGYERVLFESPFFSWLKNSVIVSVSNTIIVLFTSTLIGYVFAKFRFRGRNVLFAILMMTMMVPAQTTMIPSFMLINAMNLYDKIAALIVPAVTDAFGIYLCRQFIEEIPKDLLESARLDGAGEFRTYFSIVLPSIRPAIGALGIFTFMTHWNDYLSPLLYLTSSERMTLPLALSYFSTMHSSDLSATMAAAALITLPAMLVFLLFQKQFIKGIAITGMK